MANAEHASQTVLTSEMAAETTEIIQTLPEKFNSMIGESIDIDTDQAQELIGMLGKKLGIEDYRKNMSTFWLLDTIALEVTRIRHKMDPVNLAILISWIAGEARLIHDNQLTRKEFFRKIGFIFAQILDQLGKGRPLVYWEEITEIKSTQKYQLQSAGDQELEDLFPNVDKSLNTYSSDFILDQKSDMVIARSTEVLEAIINSTYVIYANAFHYETVSAAFARPVELRPYRLPYTLRFPRPVKPAVLPFANELMNEGVRGKVRLKTDKEKPGENKESAGRGNTKLKTPVEIRLPPPSITEEEMMMAQWRRQILPLMESNEASNLLGQFAQSQSINLVPETKLGKKAKRKT